MEVEVEENDWINQGKVVKTAIQDAGIWQCYAIRIFKDIHPCLCVIKSRFFKHDLPSALVLLASQALRKMRIKYTLF